MGGDVLSRPDCRLCGREVPASRRARPRLYCSDECRLKFNRQKRDPARLVALAVAWAKANPERMRARRQEWKERHPDAIAEQKAQWFHRHRHRIREDKWWRSMRLAFGGTLTEQEREMLAEYRKFKGATTRRRTPLSSTGCITKQT